MLGAGNRCRQILEAAPESSSDIAFRHVMTACQHAASDAVQVDFYIVRSDVNDNNLETSFASRNHHPQIIFPGERCFYRKTGASIQMSGCNIQNLAAAAIGEAAATLA